MLQKRILSTLRFFAVQHMAVTLLELHQFLVRDEAVVAASTDEDNNLIRPIEGEARVQVRNIAEALTQLVETEQVVQHLGHYVLSDSRNLLEDRWRGYRFGVLRERRIKRFAYGLQFLPFVRGVAIAGSQACGLQRKESDIDLLVITAPGWLWLPRTLVTGYFQVLGIRRYGNKIADRVCLNHYISGPKTMQVGHNWYTAFEYAKLRTIFGDAAIQDFKQANSDWIQSYFPNFSVEVRVLAKQSQLQNLLEKMLTHGIGPWLERLLGNWQGKRIHKDEKHIIVAQDELSFHPNSKEDSVLRTFNTPQ